MMLTSVALLKENPTRPTRRSAGRSRPDLRCTGYQNIVNAVRRAAKSMREA